MKRILLLLVIPLLANSDTTGNLITNGTFDNGTTGWTLTGDSQRIGDCCPGGHDLEFGPNGSIEQSFNLINDTITQPMLNNGITLDSTVEVQNGECGVAQCWGGSGPADSFTIRLQIRDENDEVLATTTQERFNVTGINGKDFSDSVSYTGTGSNIGNIHISGSDSNNRRLGGPNVDNISVTMTYDPTVLSAFETQIIATAFEEIEEILTTVSPEELFIYEEFIVEEFIPFEEPQILTEMFSEVLVEEVAIEEINTGIVNIFQEVTYEEPQTIEAFSAEVESFEEIVENTESTNIETTAETVEETEVAVESGSSSESGNANVSSETNAQSGGESNEEDSRVASQDTQTNTNIRSSNDTNAEVQDVGTESIQISVDDIRRQVENTVSSVDQQLIATQTLVAKVMSNNDILDGYNSMNQSIFDNQVNIDGGNIDDYYQRDYNDARTIYVQAQNQYNDPAFSYQRKIEEAVEDRIRAEQHLRRIRGY